MINFPAVAVATLMEGGTTVNVHTGEEPTDGYAVGGITAPYHAGLSLGRELAQRFQAYAQAHSEELSRPDRYLGTWLDTRSAEVWADVSQVYPDRATAERVARERGELAIYDLRARELIRLPEMALAAVR
jgi:hypothetical protein